MTSIDLRRLAVTAAFLSGTALLAGCGDSAPMATTTEHTSTTTTQAPAYAPPPQASSTTTTTSQTQQP